MELKSDAVSQDFFAHVVIIFLSSFFSKSVGFIAFLCLISIK